MKKLLTEWGEKLDRNCPLPEYPRPQMKRNSYVNLNGLWSYAITDGTRPVAYDGEIVVPFSPEALLSGVERQLMPGQTLWYERSFTLPEGFNRGRVLLNFGAVDQIAEVYVNQIPVGRHEGGYLPFSFDITAALREGDNLLQLAVTDDTEGGLHARGKQTLRRGGIWYTPQSGIWQTVWLESVPEVYVKQLRITPCFDDSRVEVELIGSAPAEGFARVLDGGVPVAEVPLTDGRGSIALTGFKPWTPESPFLYDLEISWGADHVESYFGMRKFSVTEHRGVPVLALNNEPYFQHGLLDQGYWSDGLYTPPSDEAMVADILRMKELGFNMLRKHIKIEPLRWYYHCDRLGMIVWQDMVSGGAFKALTMQILPFIGFHMRDTRYRRFARQDPAAREQFERDCAATVELLYNCVSIGMWVPFNEGWGQFDSLRVTQTLWDSDPTRLVDHASGWHDQGGGDLKSRHVYYRTVRMKNDGYRALALTEFGGYSLPVEGHMSSDKLFGYRVFKSAGEYNDKLCSLYEEQVVPLIEKEGLSAAVYTQLSDVEDEINGLLTYDRRVCKADRELMLALAEKLKF